MSMMIYSCQVWPRRSWTFSIIYAFHLYHKNFTTIFSFRTTSRMEPILCRMIDPRKWFVYIVNLDFSWIWVSKMQFVFLFRSLSINETSLEILFYTSLAFRFILSRIFFVPPCRGNSIFILCNSKENTRLKDFTLHVIFYVLVRTCG